MEDIDDFDERDELRRAEEKKEYKITSIQTNLGILFERGKTIVLPNEDKFTCDSIEANYDELEYEVFGSSGYKNCKIIIENPSYVFKEKI